MKFIKILFLSAFVLSFTSCGDDDKKDEISYEYHAHIESPNTDAKHLEDSIHIKVEFESHTGETIHNINVKIFKERDHSVVVYNMPVASEVNQSEGEYVYEDHIALSAADGFTEHTDYILEAKVWGPNGEDEEIEQIQFHVHPQ